MPDLDELLAADAVRLAATDGAVAAFDPAFDRAMTRDRHQRRHRAIGIGASVAAVAVAGALITATSTSAPESPERVHLAAYDRVLAAVPGSPGVYYVVGPNSGRLATECRLVPYVTVQIVAPTNPGYAFEIVTHVQPGHQFPTHLGNALPSLRARGAQPIFTLPSGRYDLFACRTG